MSDNNLKNNNEIFKKIENGEPLKIHFQFVSDDTLILLNSITARILAKYDLHYILYSMLTIIREIVVNALKANAKRVFFSNSGLDINDLQDYKKGIGIFKEKVVGDFDSIRDAVMNSSYYINYNLTYTDEGINFSVKNNAGILQQEQIRINERIDSAVKKNNFHEIYDDIEDDTEGAGLGIALVVLFLKSMGLDPASFKIRSDGKVTVTSFFIPYELKPVGVTSLVKEKILQEIKGVPTFPENIINLLDLCSSPDACIDDIVDRIKRDVAIVTDVIKMANSAGFITTKRIEDIGMAVMKIGLKNLKSILIASNARKIMESRYSKYEEIWEHCNRVAVYSRLIAEKYKMPGVAENAFLAGLLHDLGQVVLLAVDMKGIKKIAEIVHDRNIITTTVMEEISIGISHSEIGALVSEQWNFPEYLIQTIRYHHSPENIQNEYRDIVSTVYLANLFCGVEKRKYYYYYASEPVLERFRINNENELKKLHDEIKKKFEKL
jgi:HD-like signal output (HDOD) protein